MKKCVTVVLIVSLLLTGCGIAPNLPTENTTVPTSPTQPTEPTSTSSQATQPPSQPTQPPTAPPTQPSTAPTTQATQPATVPPTQEPTTIQPTQMKPLYEIAANETVIKDYQIKTCCYDFLKMNAGAMNWMITYAISSYAELQAHIEQMNADGYYDRNATCDACPQSFSEIVAQYDENFFKDHVLLKIRMPSLRGAPPTVAKIGIADMGLREPYSMTAYVENVDFESFKEDAQVFSIFVELPRTYEKYLKESSALEKGYIPEIW